MDDGPYLREGLPLFRKEALQAQIDTGPGEHMEAMPPSWSWITWLLCALLAVAIAFVTTQGFSRKETVRGFLRPAAGEIRIEAPRDGLVSVLAVGDGQHVEAGALVANIASPNSVAGEQVAGTVLRQIDEEEHALRARLEALQGGASLDARGVAAREQSARSQLDNVSAAMTIAEEQRAMAAERVAATEQLAERGFISRDEMARRRLAVMDAERALLELRSRRAALRSELELIRVERERNPYSAIEDRSELEALLAQLLQRRAETQAQLGGEVRTAVAGSATAVRVQVGQSVRAHDFLMAIAPHDAVLVAHIFVPSRAIAFVRRGQSVRLLYDALPYQRFGAGRGTIVEVSSTAVSPREAGAGDEDGEPVYRIVVRLEDQAMRAYGRQIALQSGMALTADIVLERRTFAEWIFEPVLAMRGRL